MGGSYPERVDRKRVGPRGKKEAWFLGEELGPGSVVVGPGWGMQRFVLGPVSVPRTVAQRPVGKVVAVQLLDTWVCLLHWVEVPGAPSLCPRGPQDCLREGAAWDCRFLSSSRPQVGEHEVGVPGSLKA